MDPARAARRAWVGLYLGPGSSMASCVGAGLLRLAVGPEAAGFLGVFAGAMVGLVFCHICSLLELVAIVATVSSECPMSAAGQVLAGYWLLFLPLLLVVGGLFGG